MQVNPFGFDIETGVERSSSQIFRTLKNEYVKIRKDSSKIDGFCDALSLYRSEENVLSTQKSKL